MTERLAIPPKEEWRPVVGFPLYEVSSEGRVRSWARNKTTPRILKQWPSGRGQQYLQVELTGQARRKVQHLVAEAFIGPRPEGQVLRHLNDEGHDNRVVNLAYGTPGQNIADAYANGRRVRVTHCPRNHPYDATNAYINPSGYRHCRTCRREDKRARNTAQKAVA